MATDPEILEARLKSAPWQLHVAVLSATLLGLLLAVRGLLVGMSAGTLSGKTVIYGLMIFGFFAFNAFGLFGSSKTSYVLIAVFALLPVLGSFAGALHLLTLMVGAKNGTQIETLISFLGTLQFAVIVLLFVFLLSSPTRRFVWRPVS